MANNRHDRRAGEVDGIVEAAIAYADAHAAICRAVDAGDDKAAWVAGDAVETALRHLRAVINGGAAVVFGSRRAAERRVVNASVRAFEAARAYNTGVDSRCKEDAEAACEALQLAESRRNLAVAALLRQRHGNGR